MKEMKKLFGTDGVRGIANMEPITPETVLKLAKVVGSMFKRGLSPDPDPLSWVPRLGARDCPKKLKVLLGKDTRLSGYMLESALISALTSVGVEVIRVGVIPTSAISYLICFTKADFGVVISASHNPFSDNGIKFFGRDGLKFPDELEEKIEKNLFSPSFSFFKQVGSKIGKVYSPEDNLLNIYKEFLLNIFPERLNLNGLKIVVDCANGSTYKIAPEVYKKLGAKVYPINIKPDGININRRCGALYPGKMCKLTKFLKADIGFSYDGDGDRVIISDSEGKLIDGDYIMAICGRNLLEKNKLKNKLVVATVMSNLGLEISLKEAGIKLLRAPVGDKFVFENMIKNGSVLGGEQSGHIIFLDKLSTGDGIITSLQILSIIKETGKDIKTLAECMKKFPQVLNNVRIKSKKDLNSMKYVLDAIKFAESKLNGKGRVVVRFSGTEPVVRIMLEGENKKELIKLSEKISLVIKKELG